MTKTFLSKEDELIAKLTDLGVPTSEINLCIDAADDWVDIIASRNDRTLRRITMRDFCQLTWNTTPSFPGCSCWTEGDPDPKDQEYNVGTMIHTRLDDPGWDCMAREEIADLVNELLYTSAYQRWQSIACAN